MTARRERRVPAPNAFILTARLDNPLITTPEQLTMLLDRYKSRYGDEITAQIAGGYRYHDTTSDAEALRSGKWVSVEN